MIDKDTIVCISISKKAGNFGCKMHNKAFLEKGLNYIYKSFSVDEKDLEAAVNGIRAFKIRGAGISMPFKSKILDYVDVFSKEVLEIKAANTIVNFEGTLKAYNTDAYSSLFVIREARNILNTDNIVILGNGGYSKAVEYSSKKLGLNIEKITRKNWERIPEIEDRIVFNCTPVKNLNQVIKSSNFYIDCCTKTETGSRLARLQGEKQFELYTKGKIDDNFFWDA